MTASCIPTNPAYNGHRGVENLKRGNRTRQTCGIFVCTPCLDSVYGLEGREIPNTRRRSFAVSNLQAALNRVSAFLRKSNGGH